MCCYGLDIGTGNKDNNQNGDVLKDEDEEDHLECNK